MAEPRGFGRLYRRHVGQDAVTRDARRRCGGLIAVSNASNALASPIPTGRCAAGRFSDLSDPRASHPT